MTKKSGYDSLKTQKINHYNKEHQYYFKGVENFNGSGKKIDFILNS